MRRTHFRSTLRAVNVCATTVFSARKRLRNSCLFVGGHRQKVRLSSIHGTLAFTPREWSIHNRTLCVSAPPDESAPRALVCRPPAGAEFGTLLNFPPTAVGNFTLAYEKNNVVFCARALWKLAPVLLRVDTLAATHAHTRYIIRSRRLYLEGLFDSSPQTCNFISHGKLFSLTQAVNKSAWIILN